MEDKDHVCDYCYSDTLNEKDIQHFKSCSHCLNAYFGFEKNLNNLLISKYNNMNEDLISDIKPDFENNWENLTNDQIYFYIAIQKRNSAYRNLKTPKFLKDIVDRELDQPAETHKNRLIIKLQNGLEVIGNYINDLLVIPGSLEMVPTRGTGNTNQGNFIDVFQAISDKELIQYQVIQDGPETVMLTIRVDNPNSHSVFVGLRSENKLISSKPLNDNYAYFPKIGAGNYEIEANFENRSTPVFVPVTIIA